MSISNRATKTEHDAELERVWQSFWLPIIGRPDGSIDMAQVKKELHDAHMVFDHCRKAYMWMTNDQVGNVTTEPEVVITIAGDIRTQEIKEAIEDELEIKVDEGVQHELNEIAEVIADDHRKTRDLILRLQTIADAWTSGRPLLGPPWVPTKDFHRTRADAVEWLSEHGERVAAKVQGKLVAESPFQAE